MGTIFVEDTRIQEPATAVLLLDERAKGPVTDGGDLLKTIPGISGSRMGGHGMEPVIRGQSQNRINILLDGAYVHGGCPNRMDPPSSYGTSETYDEIEVIKGAQSVKHGGGGSGGTVLFKRMTERFSDDQWYRGKASSSYRGNSNVREGFVDVAVGNPNGFGRVIGNVSQGDDYEDGNGNQVRASYKEATGNIILGWTPNDHSRVEVNYETTQADDVTYAGAGMDTPYTDHTMLRLKLDHKWQKSRLLRGIKTELYLSQVDHLMDNYSLREPPTMTMMMNGMSTTQPMYMRTPSESDTFGGRVQFQLASGVTEWSIGLDHQDNDRTATASTSANFNANNVNLETSYIWPDASIETTGLFAEMERPLGNTNRLKSGLRIDFVQAEADRTNIDPQADNNMVMSPRQLYTRYYGSSSSHENETNIGGLLRFEHDEEDHDATLYLSLSRSVRTADATERFIAKNNAMDESARWVGNPFLDPEKHHQLDLGAQIIKTTWDLDVSLYYNVVKDYILRDRDHSQGNATIYRNVDADLFGGELSVNRRWNPQLRSGINMAYVYATNTTDKRAIAQTPPLEIAITSDYEKNNWHVGGKLRLVARQPRVDDNIDSGSGLDIGKTTGFQVVDFYGSYQFHNNVKLKAGVNNLLDRNYSEHLNKSNTFDTTTTRIHEPGRSFWLTAGLEF